MGDRPDLPRIKPDKAPSYFNREAGGWGYLGGFIGSTIATISILGKKVDYKSINKTLGIALGIQTVGLVFGAIKGHARQEKEMTEGRVVKSPTIWNSGYFSGATIGALVLLPISLANHFGKMKLPMSMVALATEFGAGTLGMYKRKESMQQDFDKAMGLRQQEIGAVKEKLHVLERTTTMPTSYKNSVSAAEAEALAEKQGGATSHAEQLAASASEAEFVRGT